MKWLNNYPVLEEMNRVSEETKMPIMHRLSLLGSVKAHSDADLNFTNAA